MKAFHTSLILKSSKKNLDNEGKAAVQIRIVRHGKTIHISTKEKVEPSRWKKTKGFKLSKTDSDEYYQRQRILVKVGEVSEICNKILSKGVEISADGIKKHLKGDTPENEKPVERTFFKTFDEYKDRFMELAKNGKREKLTFNKYNSMKKNLIDFFIIKYRKEDVLLKELDKNFLSEFYFFLQNRVSNDTCNNYIKSFRYIINFAVDKDYLTFYPFKTLSLTYDNKEVQTISYTEFETIRDAKIDNKSLDVIRDLFIFACVTGFSWCDLNSLKEEDVFSEKNNKLFRKERGKTGITALPVFTTLAKNIIDKYRNHPRCIAKGILIPMISNKEVNKQLKLLAAVCGIKGVNLTCHKARHFFAMTALNISHVPLEVVGKMIGHATGSRQTGRYAKVTEQKVISHHKQIAAVFAA